MSGETENQPSAWTIDSLHSLILRLLEECDLRYEQRFEAQETAMKERDLFLERLAQERQTQVRSAFEASQTAIDKADRAYEKRFEGVNEFRLQLADQARDFMPRKESELQHAALNDRLDIVQRLQATQGGQSSGREQFWGYLIGAVGLLAAVTSIVVAILATR